MRSLLKIVAWLLFWPVLLPFWLWKKGSVGRVLAGVMVVLFVVMVATAGPQEGAGEPIADDASVQSTWTPTPVATETPTVVPTMMTTATEAPAVESPTQAPIETSTATASGSAGPTVNGAANLRGGPGTEYDMVGSAAAGDGLSIVGRNAAGDWYQLATGAWIAGFLVDDAPGDVAVVEAPPLPTAAPAQEPSQAAGNCNPGQVDLNSANYDELRQIINIDEVFAQEIIDRRPWPSIDSLISISGIGPVRLSQIKEQGLACVN